MRYCRNDNTILHFDICSKNKILSLQEHLKKKAERQNSLIYKTFLTQEMLKRGFLSSNLIFVCTEHCENVISEYFVNLDELFAVIAQCEENDNAVSLLDSEVCHSGFKRLN